MQERQKQYSILQEKKKKTTKHFESKSEGKEIQFQQQQNQNFIHNTAKIHSYKLDLEEIHTK